MIAEVKRHCARFETRYYGSTWISFLREQWNNLLLLLLFASALFLIYIYILRKRRIEDSVLEQSRSGPCYEQKSEQETKGDRVKEDNKWVRFRGSRDISQDVQCDLPIEYQLPSRIDEPAWLDSDQSESDQEIVYPIRQQEDDYYSPVSGTGILESTIREWGLEEGEVEDRPRSEDESVRKNDLQKGSEKKNANGKLVDIKRDECVTGYNPPSGNTGVVPGRPVEDKPFSVLHDLSVNLETGIIPESKPLEVPGHESRKDGDEITGPVERPMSDGATKEESTHDGAYAMDVGKSIHQADYVERYYDLGEWSDLTVSEADKAPPCNLSPVRSATTVNDAGFSSISEVFYVKLLTDDTEAYASEDTSDQAPVTPRPSPESSFDNADVEDKACSQRGPEEAPHIRHSVQPEEQAKQATAGEVQTGPTEDSKRSQDTSLDQSIQPQASHDEGPRMPVETPVRLESGVSHSPKRDSAVRRISSRWEAAVQPQSPLGFSVTQTDAAKRLPTLPERQSSLQNPPKERVEVIATARSLPTDVSGVISEPCDEWPDRDVYFRTLNSARSSISASSISQLFSSSQETVKQSTESLLSEEGPGGKDSNGSLKLHRKIKQLYSGCIEDRFDNLEDLSAAIEEAGLSHSRVIIGIDYSISNLETGRKCFGGKSLHNLDNRISNPYQEVIRILCNTLNQFDEDNLICAFGFGDSWSTDRYVFPLSPAGLFCRGFDGVLQAYNMKTPTIKLGGPTNFAPLIRESIQIVKTSKTYTILIIIADGQVVDEGDTVNAIVEASEYPISIILVGVGDGPWDTMHEFDDALPARRFDNFQFVNYQKVCQLSSMVPRGVTTSTDYMFALMALMEIPDQYQIIKDLGYIDAPALQTP